MRKDMLPAVLAGGLFGACADLWVACTLTGFGLMRIGKAVARGWFEAASKTGGTDVALIGLVSHVTIVLVFAAVFVAASLRLPILLRLWFVTGPLYGATIFCVMRFVVLPLSAAGYSMPKPPGLYWEIAGHLFLVGLPIALSARWFLRERSQTP